MTSQLSDYATTVLHNLVQHMDVEPSEVEGHVTLSAIVPAQWLPALELFDADGDPDLEEACDDEGCLDNEDMERCY